MGDQIEELLSFNEDKVPKSMYDELNAAFDESTGEYNEDKLNEFYKKNKSTLETLKGYNEFDWSFGKPLKERLEGANYEQFDPNYIEGLALKLHSTPEEVASALSEIKAKKDAAKEKQKLADEYKREAEARYARQKAVDEYQYPYFGMDLDNPVNKGLNWVADQLISDKTKRAVVEDPNDAGRIAGNIAVDIGGTAVDLMPGVGGYVIGPALRTGRNIAEGDKAGSIIKDAAFDFGGNAALAKGLKGIPGIGDLGPLRKVEEKIPLNEWAAKAKTAKTPVKNVVLELPPADPKEIGKWIEKQPAELRKEFYKVVEENPSNVREALIKKIDELGDIANKDTYKQMVAEQWVKENPWKARIGTRAEPTIVGIERTVTEHGTRTPTEYKTGSPKKIKTYDDAISFIIDNTKKQWEAGFVPTPDQGIVYEAYKKWESER